MKTAKNMVRPLNRIEEALTLINAAFPFSVICVLRLNSGPTISSLRSALDRLQKAHPLLNAGIRERKGHFWFELDQDALPIPLLTEPREDDNHWLKSAREELNRGFDHGKASLIRIRYLVSPSDGGDSEIILSFHHAITDAISLLSLTDQLLTWSCEDDSGETSIPLFSSRTVNLSSVSGLKATSFLNSPRIWFRFLPFMFDQIRDELKYRKANLKVKDSVIPSSPDNDLLTFSFSVEETTALIKWGRGKKLSLNGMITASMLKVMNNHKYGGKKELLRTVQFANLRPYLVPPVSDTDLGSYIALMRFTVPSSSGSDIGSMATFLDNQLLSASRKGDKFIFAFLSKMLVKKTIREHKVRLGATALSYAGPIQLKTDYRKTRLTDIHGYITNNCLGAELTAFGKIFNGRLCLDLNFLSEELSHEKAATIAEEIQLSLLNLVRENE